MSDRERRLRQREAAVNPGEQEMNRMVMAEKRAGNGRHADKIEKWVAIYGFRDHFRGRLLEVVEMGGGKALAKLHPCYWMSNMETGQGRVIPSSEENPAELYLDVQLIALQPEGWSTE